jgi:hypothetical protein
MTVYLTERSFLLLSETDVKIEISITEKKEKW